MSIILFLAVLGGASLIFGVKMQDNGLLRIRGIQSVTYFEQGKEITVSPPKYIGKVVHRVDLPGDEEVVMQIIGELSARLLWVEEVSGAKIFYCYSLLLPLCRTVKGEKVNLMIAVSGDTVKAGTPLLIGSF